MSEDDQAFFDRVTRSLRGELSPSEQQELDQLIQIDPAKRRESEKMLVTYDLLSLCAATEAEPREIPVEVLEGLRSHAKKYIKPKPARVTFGPFKVFFGLALAAVFIIGIVLLCARLTNTSPRLEYALISNSGTTDVAMNAATNAALDAAGVAKPEAFENVLRRVLGDVNVQRIEVGQLHDWENNWQESNTQPVFKVLIQEEWTATKLASHSGLVKVVGRWQGANFQKTFQVTKPDGLPTAINEAQYFIEQSVQRNGR